MCGFVGIASPKHQRAIARADLGRMLAPIAYRGPDDEAFVEGAGFGLGFRRLAIIDPANGRQPMTTTDGRLTLVCNGEIYDHVELRAELSAKGHVFRTRSDSEAVLHAYAEWGAACAERLRGIFAFAIWDADERTLFLCRDRSGIKPLYVHIAKDEILFASEAKAILAHPSVERRLDAALCFAPPEPDIHLEPSPFVGISQLGAGVSLTYGADGEARTRRYWTYAPVTEPGDDDEHGIERDIEQFREELDRVVAMQLMSDVPLGACLSGGLDSSLLVAIASERKPGLSTFTSVADGSHDAWFAFMLSRAKGLDSHFTKLDPDAVGRDLPLVAWGAEGLFDLAFVSRLALARSARDRGITVLLSGQGVDELLGGYDKTYAGLTRAAIREDALGKLLHGRFSEVGPMLAKREADSDRETDAKVASLLRRQHAELSHYLLRFEDRMGMLASVEVRVPFLDHRLVEICARIPPSRRRALFGDKRLVREAAKGRVPDSVRLREKFAFNGNLPSLSRTLEASGEAGAALLLTDDATTRSKGYFDPARVGHLRETRNEHLLDAVLVVHWLDELFVSRFDPARFANAHGSRAHEVAVDERWMPAEALLFAARAEPRPSDVPSLSHDVTYVGLLHRVGSSSAGSSETVLVVRTTSGDDALITRLDTVDPESAVRVLRSIDGTRSYAELAAITSVPVESVLTIGQVFGRKGIVTHETRTAPEARKQLGQS